MSWVPIMASLQANLKEIKRPTTPYIAIRQMNWPPLSNWNPLFVQQTSVSLPNGCDIIDSNINDSAVHNWAWPTDWKYSHGTKAVDVTAKFIILICQWGRQWTQHLMLTSRCCLSPRESAKYDITAGLISSTTGSTVQVKIDESGWVLAQQWLSIVWIRDIYIYKGHFVTHLLKITLLLTMFCHFAKAWQSILKVLGMTWQKSNYHRRENSQSLVVVPVIKK